MSSIFKKAKDRSSKEKLRTTSGTSIHSYNPHNPLNAPTEVAQATQFHQARNANELSFKRGDFFHVLQDGHIAPDSTIEIFDPIRNIKGRAPANCFKIFEKTHRPNDENRISSNNINNNASNNSSPISTSNPQTPNTTRHASTASATSYSSQHKEAKALGNLFGVVLYDFNAERSDELSVTAGDIIFICAHHQYEWYIAKFLNKVGEVGLVPVSYVQLIDAVTRIPYKETPRSIIESENLPTVDEWKIMKNKHKSSSRNVGNNTVNSNGDLSRNSSQNNHSARTTSITRSPLKRNINEALSIPIKTNIESFSSTNNKFWFLIRVTMSDGSTRSLCRYYEDFFNFHQKLLSTWPKEGGKTDTKEKKERILPFIPGPVLDVTESLCHKRLIDLNGYLAILLQLPEYISKSNLVLSFFDLMDGDSTDSNKSSSGNLNHIVEPNRPAPNLKIINSDNRTSNPNKFNTPPPENLSQSSLNRRSQYDNKNINNNRSSVYSNNKLNDYQARRSSSSLNSLQQQTQFPSINSASVQPTNKPPTDSTKIKLKFYYNDDIFALSIPSNIRLLDLKKMITPKLDDANTPDIELKLQLYSKNSKNSSNSNYDKSQIINSDSLLWNDENFIDRGKFLVII